ncbi:MAG: hypothetical protein V1897_06355 [Pseudomonadota bacterium]
MNLLIGLIVASLVLYFLFQGKGKRSSASKSTTISKQERILDSNSDWLKERWKAAEEERNAGKQKSVPRWFLMKSQDGSWKDLKQSAFRSKTRT